MSMSTIVTSSFPFQLFNKQNSSSSSSFPSSSFSSFSTHKINTSSKRVICSISIKSRFGSSSNGGSGLLERPTFDQSEFGPVTQVQQGGDGGDMGRHKDKKTTGSGDSYRVLLLDDSRHTENIVAKILPQAVPSITQDDARKMFQQSRHNGVAVVIVAVKEHAEFYSEMLNSGGLRSTIEPDSKTVGR